MAKDVCDVLGFPTAGDALRGLEDDEKQRVKINSHNMRGNPNRYIINEPGLYSLILRSRKPEAKAFDFKGNTVRTFTDDEGNLWFVAKDVCAVLELDTNNIHRDLEYDERMTLHKRGIGIQEPGNPYIAVVNEPGSTP